MNEESFKMPELVAQVAAAYFSNSPVAVADIPLVMRGIAAGLSLVEVGDAALISAVTQDAEPTGAAEPPVRRATNTEIRESIGPDGLTSFENGKTYRTLKRHLSLRGLTPALYREKWGLPNDYPMTAASYSAARSAVAKRIGLGGKTAPKPNRRRRK